MNAYELQCRVVLCDMKEKYNTILTSETAMADEKNDFRQFENNQLIKISRLEVD